MAGTSAAEQAGFSVEERDGAQTTVVESASGQSFRESVRFDEHGNETVMKDTSFLGAPTLRVVMDQEVANLDEWLHDTPGNPRVKQGRVNIPVFSQGFKCPYGTKPGGVFNYITDCHIKREDREKIQSWRSAVEERAEEDPKFMAMLITKHTVDYNRDISPPDLEIQELKADKLAMEARLAALEGAIAAQLKETKKPAAKKAPKE